MIYYILLFIIFHRTRSLDLCLLSFHQREENTLFFMNIDSRLRHIFLTLRVSAIGTA